MLSHISCRATRNSILSQSLVPSPTLLVLQEHEIAHLEVIPSGSTRYSILSRTKKTKGLRISGSRPAGNYTLWSANSRYERNVAS